MEYIIVGLIVIGGIAFLAHKKRWNGMNAAFRLFLSAFPAARPSPSALEGESIPAPVAASVPLASDPRVGALQRRVEQLEKQVGVLSKASPPMTAAEVERMIEAALKRAGTPLASPVSAPVPSSAPPVLEAQEVEKALQIARLPPGAGGALAAATSFEEVGRLVVTNLLPARPDRAVAESLNEWLGAVSNARVWLILPAAGSRLNSEEAVKTAERPIERGIFGLVTAVIRPGIRVDGAVLLHAEIEQGV